MKSKPILAVGLSLLVVSVLCVGLVSTGYVAYQLFDLGDIPILDQPPSLPFIEDPGTPEETFEPVRPETPMGAEVNLGPLFAPFWQSWELLHENFYYQPLDNQLMLQGALDGLYTTLEEAGIDVSSIELPEDADAIRIYLLESDTPEELEEIFEPFWETWRLAEYADIGTELTYETLMENSLRGMVKSLDDPYTSYMTPDQYRQATLPLEGEYQGIGAYVDTSGDYVTIITPMQNSPAENAGLLPGDQIIAVDGEDLTDIAGDLVIRRVLGPAGSTVILTILREGVPEPFDVEIIRAHIVIPTTEFRMLDDNIAYVRLFVFGDNTEQELRSALEELLLQNPDGLILDLRNNGGGWLTTAIAVTSEFVGEGVALYEEYGDETVDIHHVTSGGVATKIPMVVLVNGGTASASEIVAGAIQDTERGLLIGTTTFGKGVVQVSMVLPEQQGAIRITTALWFTPDERLIHGIGLEPDIVVDVTEADIEAEFDPQLEKAIETLLAGSGN